MVIYKSRVFVLNVTTLRLILLLLNSLLVLFNITVLLPVKIRRSTLLTRQFIINPRTDLDFSLDNALFAIQKLRAISIWT